MSEHYITIGIRSRFSQVCMVVSQDNVSVVVARQRLQLIRQVGWGCGHVHNHCPQPLSGLHYLNWSHPLHLTSFTHRKLDGRCPTTQLDLSCQMFAQHTDLRASAHLYIHLYLQLSSTTQLTIKPWTRQLATVVHVSVICNTGFWISPCARPLHVWTSQYTSYNYWRIKINRKCTVQ